MIWFFFLSFYNEIDKQIDKNPFLMVVYEEIWDVLPWNYHCSWTASLLNLFTNLFH